MSWAALLSEWPTSEPFHYIIVLAPASLPASILITYVVVELVPGEGELVRTVLGIEKTIIGVLVANNTDGREVVMVDPNFGGLVNVNEIFALGCAVELQVSNDDVRDLADLETTIGKTGIATNTEDGGVAGGDLDDAAASKSALDLDHTSDLSRSGKLSAGSDSGAGTATASSCASGETNQLINLGGTLLDGCGVSRRGGQGRNGDTGEMHVECRKIVVVENVSKSE